MAPSQSTERPAPHGVVQLVHGMAEHIDRFTRQLRLYADTPLAGSAEECPDAALVPAADRKA